MRVIKLDEGDILRGKRLRMRGNTWEFIANRLGVTPKTLRRARKLYEKHGDTIFEREKQPQKGRGSTRTFKVISDKEKYKMLYRRW